MFNYIKEKALKVKLPRLNTIKAPVICNECKKTIVDPIPSSPYRSPGSSIDDNKEKPVAKIKEKKQKFSKLKLAKIVIALALVFIPMTILSFMHPLTIGRFSIIFCTGLVGTICSYVLFLVGLKGFKLLLKVLKLPYFLGKWILNKFNVSIEWKSGVRYKSYNAFSNEIYWLVGVAPVAIPFIIYIFGQIIISTFLSMIGISF